MKIGIAGLGNVGNACRHGFLSIGHTVFVHDIKLGTSIHDIVNSEIVYICVPTPMGTSQQCDTSIVDHVISSLTDLDYQGIIAIKSTVNPGYTDAQLEKTKLPICFVPEFLRERYAVEDFLNEKLLAVGTHSSEIFESICQSYGILSKNPTMMLPIESELLKYYSNTFNAARVVFANIMYEICSRLNADYDKILDTYLLRETASRDYLDCNEKLRGFGGMCLPKDTHAINILIKQLGLNYSLFESVINDNKQFKITLRDD